jgi:glucose-1-phosphate thymidylyltransferase
MNRKGIILSGGKGTRLFPVTLALSKQLLPIYNKPMIYYPLSTMMSIGIKEILIITTPFDFDRFKFLLGDGSKWGINLYFKVQEKPNGIAEAFILAEKFIDKSPSALILGDNLFYGHNLSLRLRSFSKKPDGATVFAYPVKNPERYGIVNYNKEKKIISIEEKPIKSKSKHAVTGLYFYDKNVVKIAKSINPSKRGELEITDLNNIYLKENKLEVCFLDNGDTWLDAGSNDTLMEASQFIKAIENRQGIMVSSPEETAWKNGWINDQQLEKLAKELSTNEYGNNLMKLIKK